MAEIAIIGAGIAGVAAARRLVAAGRDVRIFEKSRGLGGRAATRRAAGLRWNHGAPWVPAKDPAFRLLLLAHGGREVPGGVTGADGMAPLIGRLAEGLAVETEREVTGILPDLRLETGTGTEGPFARVISTVPVTQALRIGGDLATEAGIGAAEMEPRWTLLLGFETQVEVTAEGVEALRTGLYGDARSWVVHASAEWSRTHLELDRDEVAERMAAMLGLLPPTVYRAAHRWRFALAGRPLGRPFGQAAGGRILFGGDWTLGATGDDAWASGEAMAEAILG